VLKLVSRLLRGACSLLLRLLLIQIVFDGLLRVIRRFLNNSSVSMALLEISITL